MQAASVQVLELEEPVEDEMGYVYEKAAILAYIIRITRRPGEPVPCPVAGTPGLHACV